MRVRRHTVALALGSIGALLAAQAAHGGGLYIAEFGQPSMGTSSAGAGVLAEDASTAATNPAGIMKLDDSQWMVAGLGIFSSTKFSQQPGTTVTAAGSAVPGSGSNGGDAGGPAVGFSAAYARPLNDKWGFGISLNSISGAVMEYEQPQDWVGRYWAQEVDLLTITVQPAIAYKVTENFSVAVGLPVLFGNLDLEVAVPGALPGDPEGLDSISDGEATSVTGRISALWDINDRARLGFTYAGENELDFDSDLVKTDPEGLTTNFAASVEIPFAQTARLYGSYDISDTTTLLATFAWEDWSTFDNLLISTEQGSTAKTRDWEDTWKYALRARFRAGNNWTWYTGAAYDPSPTSADRRTADMPMDRQVRLSVGATRARGDRVIGFAITYADFGSGKINNGGTRPESDLPWTVVGDYGTNRIIFLAFNVNTK